MKPVWVDPPSGWKFGFPKLYTPKDGETMEDWLRSEGVPESIIELNWVRMWYDE